MKSVLKRVSSKSCEKIINGECTILLSKTCPKLETPFKCYIYCTKKSVRHKHIFWGDEYRKPTNDLLCKIPTSGDVAFIESPIINEGYKKGILNGKVIGEFVCDKIEKFVVGSFRCDDIEELSCLNYAEIINYFYKPEELDGKTAKFGYAWHITDLKIYDKPKELGEFYVRCGDRKMKCQGCKYEKQDSWFDPPYCEVDGHISLNRPPQSWCYVNN